MSDFKHTIRLPKTPFSMKANLAQKEPKILEKWEKENLYHTIIQKRQGSNAPRFILHDGPPYANGHLHIGHALNKILKDVVTRTKSMQGFETPLIPGWDCHGLPIEWEVEAGYRKKGLEKKDINPSVFRSQCRDFANKWVKIQKEEFKRFGVLADWENPYLTMDFKAEAQTVRELGKFLCDGSLYMGQKPVLWSAVEQTALAEAEIEYREHKSPIIFVLFSIQAAGDADLVGKDIVIWTTTPWTIPGNRALAYGPDFDYGLYRIDAIDESNDPSKAKVLAKIGTELLLAKSLAPTVMEAAGVTGFTLIKDQLDLTDIVAKHPFYDVGFDFDVRLLPADFVTNDQGTGFVHIAPGHGEDDFKLGMEYGVEVPQTVDEAGVYYDHVPVFAGARVLEKDGKSGNANGLCIKTLLEQDRLLAKGSIKHSYPHSWRSKAPLIFRTTKQWFISLSKNGLQDRALRAIEDVNFVPAQSKNRLTAMIQNRPDWCISRQRFWGSPITVFVNNETGEPLRDPNVIERIAKAIEEKGCDAWFDTDASVFLGDEYNAADYTKIEDVLDVWFDSGATNSFVLDGSDRAEWPADLYLEGSDQHRGWFQHSLLHGVATRGGSPFKNLFTHGFTVDEKGYKMSKSVGNTVSPDEVMKTYGADILRLWAVASDYFDDVRLGNDILKQHADTYRRIRNTFRFILGCLAEFDPDTQGTKPFEMPSLERFVLHRLWALDQDIQKAIEVYDFQKIYQMLYHFCNNDLSAFYFDIRKDALYCDEDDSTVRRSCLTVMNEIFLALVKWLSPILCFTMEEVWQTRFGEDAPSVHLGTFHPIPHHYQNDALAEKWDSVRDLRRVVLGAIEEKRASKEIGSSLEAHPVVYATEEHLRALEGVDFADICITSSIGLLEGEPEDEQADVFTLADVHDVSVIVGKAEGQKCERCWKIEAELGDNGLCSRCNRALSSH